MYSLRDGYIAGILLAFSCCVTLAFSKNAANDEIPESSILQGAVDALEARELSAGCRDEFTRFAISLANGELWALNMADASSKLQSGILRGNIRDIGMYDQCVQIRREENAANVRGRHCMASMSLTSPSSLNDTLVSSRRIVESAGRIIHSREESSSVISIGLTSSICVPSACGPDDAVEIINAIISTITNELDILDVGVRASAASCSPLRPEDFSIGEILAIILLAVIIGFIVLCTICDFLLNVKTLEASKVLVTLAKFSLLKNGAVLFNTKITSNTMPSLQGIRFLSMCWVIIAHRYSLTVFAPQANLLDIADWWESWHAMYIFTAPFAVDTFFVISGFLMTYLTLKALRSGGRMNVPMLYLHRYLRLTPAFGIMILITALLLPRLGSGALWGPISNIFAENCRNNWWHGLLYIHNYYDMEFMCLPHSWYLAVDMQLFWLSPFVIYPLHRWPKLGVLILWSLLVASIVTPTTILATNQYTNVLFDIGSSIERNLEDFNTMYIPAYCRATAYFVGILLAHHMLNMNARRTLTKVHATVIWIVTSSLLLFCSVVLYVMYRDEYVYNIYLETIYAAVSRLFWSIGIAWFVFATTQGYAGPITKFLSLPIFSPLSRLSYCIYLIHFMFQVVDVGSTRLAGYFSDYQMFSSFCSDLIIAIALAVPYSLFFESPIIVLEKILKGPRRAPVAPGSSSIAKMNDESGKSNHGFQV